MVTAGSSVRKRVWRKVVVALTVGVVAIGALILVSLGVSAFSQRGQRAA